MTGQVSTRTKPLNQAPSKVHLPEPVPGQFFEDQNLLSNVEMQLGFRADQFNFASAASTEMCMGRVESEFNTLLVQAASEC